MTKLSLERVMETTFIELGQTDGSGEVNYESDASKALRAYNKQIGLLARTGRLSAEIASDLIEPSFSRVGQIQAAADEILKTTFMYWPPGARRSGMRPDVMRLFEPGISAVLADNEGRILDVYDNPNDNPVLKSYGTGFEYKKIAQERFAQAHTGSQACWEGYGAVVKALTGQELDQVPYGERVHIGGASTPDQYLGVSGVLLTSRGLARLEKLPEIAQLAQEARTFNYHDGFEGNLFAGSVDSSIANEILEVIRYDRSVNKYVSQAWLTGAIEIRAEMTDVNVH